MIKNKCRFIESTIHNYTVTNGFRKLPPESWMTLFRSVSKQNRWNDLILKISHAQMHVHTHPLCSHFLLHNQIFQYKFIDKGWSSFYLLSSNIMSIKRRESHVPKKKNILIFVVILATFPRFIQKLDESCWLRLI